MVSSLISYSRRREIVPRRADAVGGKDMAKVSEVAIQAGAARKPLGDKRRDRAMREGLAECPLIG